MPFHPVLNGTMCHIRYQNGTNLMETTHAYRYVGSSPPMSDLLALATAIGTGGLVAAHRAATSTGVTYREVYCRNLEAEFANEATYVFPSGITGQRSGSQVAASEACGIVTRTGLTGRGMHGRKSISNFAEGDVDGNSVGSTLMGLLGNLALQFLVDYVGGGNTFIAALAHIPRILGPAGTTTILSEALVLDNNVDSQKTRLNSHGR